MPLDTPDASDVEDTDIVELELLGTPRKRKEKANDISNDAKRARYRVSQGGRGSNEFDPPSGIQVTSRQHPSPSITRTGRGTEIHSVPGSSKRTNVAGGIAGGNSGHYRDRAIINNSGIATDRRNAAFVAEPEQTISRPSIARKRTARKYATGAFKSISAPSVVTRPIQRTREEKKRQNSVSSSSESLPYSPTTPVKIPNGGKIADKRARKAAHSIGSSQPTPSVGPRKSAVPRRTLEIIDITSDGESASLSASFSRVGKPTSRDVVVIDSGDERTPKHPNSAKAPSISSTTQATSNQVIEIHDSSDEEPTSSSKIDSFEEDKSLPQDMQYESMDELDRLSLLAEQSPQDGALVPPPESSPESSESVLRESSSDPGGSEKECVSPPIMSINGDGNIDMDIDSIVPAFQEDKGSHPCRDIQATSTTSDFETDILPASQYSASPRNSTHVSPPRSLSPQSIVSSKPVEMGLSVPISLESPSRGSAPKSSIQGGELVQKWPRVQADLHQRRKRLSHDEVDIHRTHSSVLAKRNHSGRNLSLSSLPVVNPHEKPELDVPRPSPGMNLADAITQASQANNRTHVRNYSRTETVPEATGKPIDHGEGIQAAIDGSRLFMRMVQKTVSLDSRQKKQHQSEIGVMKTTDQHSVQNQLDQRTEDPMVDSGSSGNSRQSSSESGILTSPEIRQQNPPSVESSLAIMGNTDRPTDAEPNTEDIPVQESDDELEYIDEDVVQNLANIDITNQVASDEEVVDGHLDSEPTPKGAVQPAHGSITRASSPEPMDMFDPTADGEETIPRSALPSSRKSALHEATHSEIPPTIKIDGFTILNWRDFRQDLSNFAPNYHLAKDLPHELQDHINHMSEWTRSLPDMRIVFRAAIQENTASDEPDAPPIQVENYVDDEPTPPWEFHYSNQMWHGEGVPPPDIKSLVSCDCIGRCDPRSKTCACVRRQREAFEDPNADFAYDNKGRLKELGYPIFECNDLCGCDDDCRNRVVQHGRTSAISIRKTANKGWGVFADQKKIYKGTFIGIYAGEIITDEAGEERGFKYDKLGKTYLFDIDFHHLRKDHTDWTSKYTVDAYHAGNFTRFLNHSCDPNCTLNPCYINEGNIDKPLLTVFARRDIEPGEELCFSYSGDPDDDESMDPSDDTGGQKNDAVYTKCYCGAKNCKGRLFD